MCTTAQSHTKEFRKSPTIPSQELKCAGCTDVSCSRGKYGEDFFGLASTYFQGRPPKSVNFYWRKFRVADIPLDDQEKFNIWLREEWYKKDALMEEYMTTGRFPASVGAEKKYIETEVRTRHHWEVLQIFAVVGICGLIWNNIRKSIQLVSKFVGL